MVAMFATLVGLVAAKPGVATASPLSEPVAFTVDLSTFVERESGRFTGPTPTFKGTAPGNEPVTVNIYEGAPTSGHLVATAEAKPSASGTWTVGPVERLPNGTYTLQAEQEGPHNIRYEEEVPFAVDANPPPVTLTSPASGTSAVGSSQALSGSAGTDEGDEPATTIRLYAGSSVAGAALRSPSVDAVNGSWSAVLEGLSPGTYTAQAEQSDDVGNVGRSQAVTFTLAASPQPSLPAASFKWIPAAPHTGEPVTLVSTSTDLSSPITAFAWALAGNGIFGPGESTLATSFSTPGAHVVQLRVTDVDGVSSTVAETIAVTSPAPMLMQPFPIVRIVGSYGSSAAKISLLDVVAPVGATVRVTCHGGGCSTRSQRLVVGSGRNARAGTVLITFHRFERTLLAGAFLDVRVSRQGQIGKFTRLRIRHGRPPSRTDLCLNADGTAAFACPTA